MKHTAPHFFATPLLVLALSATVVAGCRAKSSLPGAGNGQTDALQPVKELPIATDTTPPATTGPFAVTARAVETEVKAGKPVALEIEVKNISPETATLNFSSGQSFDFSATREGEKKPVWIWSMDKLFAQALRSQQLEAGKSLKFTAQWEDAPAGRYTIQGTITANGGLNAAPFTVVVG